MLEKTNPQSNKAKKEQILDGINSLDFPHLTIDEISAHFVQPDVTNMVNQSENGAYLYESLIEEITQNINNDYKKVRDLLQQLGEQ